MSESITLKPSSVVSSSGTISDSSYAYDDDINTKATIYNKREGTSSSTSASYSASGYIYFLMDFSQIPSDAEIVSSTVGGKIYRSFTISNYRTSSKTCTLGAYNGTTSIATVSITTEGTDEYSVQLTKTQTETWINSNSPRIRCYGSCGGRVKAAASYQRTITIYIFDLYAIIEYERSGVKFKTRIDGTWIDGAVSAKVGGAWVKPKEAFIKKDGVWQPIS